MGATVAATVAAMVAATVAVRVPTLALERPPLFLLAHDPRPLTYLPCAHISSVTDMGGGDSGFGADQ